MIHQDLFSGGRAASMTTPTGSRTGRCGPSASGGRDDREGAGRRVPRPHEPPVGAQAGVADRKRRSRRTSVEAELDAWEARGVNLHTVMVTYNRLELTKQAIASYLETATGPWSLIVVDNASTDGTVNGCTRDDRRRRLDD